MGLGEHVAGLVLNAGIIFAVVVICFCVWGLYNVILYCFAAIMDDFDARRANRG